MLVEMKTVMQSTIWPGRMSKAQILEGQVDSHRDAVIRTLESEIRATKRGTAGGGLTV